MSLRILLHCLFGALLVAPLAAQRADDPNFRGPSARADQTIFSPLDLPAPNSMRTGAGAPGPDYWQQQVDYAIEARIEPSTRLVAAKARIRYTNHSPDPLDYLWLHLEQNVFRPDSVGAKIGARAAIGLQNAEGRGYRIHRVRDAAGTKLPLSVYDTLGRIDLAEPLAPHGGQLEFEIVWDFQIPERVFRRFGIEQVEQGEVIQVAQWFPAVAVYDDVHGWNTLPYLGTGEFYNNFGDYDLSITAPRGWTVVATGALQNPAEVFTPTQLERWQRAHNSAETIEIIAPEEVGTDEAILDGQGPLTWRFRAEQVRTVAFATSNAFVLDAAGLGDTLVQSAYPKEGLPLWAKSTQMLRTAIEGYNERWFKYPYPVATNVNGIEGGMEYPMIIFCRARRSEAGLYGVTTHEIGHNWFPMIVNTDERRHAWMDEGFNTFINYYSRRDWFPDSEGGRAHPAGVAQLLAQPNQVPVATPADHLPGSLLGALQYTKTGAGLVLLRETILGPERFDFAFRKYIERWAFKSPRPADFFRTMEDAAGADLAWFWRGWFLEVHHLDQALGEVEPAADGRGPTIEVLNLTDMVMPVRLRVEFEDGSVEDLKLPVEVWYNRHRIVERLRTDKSIRAVTLDPEEELPDANRRNNLWPKVD
ncbi:MAG: peptidase [Planctomycetes bacterium]|nr:peptidase [Planctomycetota bacterium]